MTTPTATVRVRNQAGQTGMVDGQAWRSNTRSLVVYWGRNDGHDVSTIVDREALTPVDRDG